MGVVWVEGVGWVVFGFGSKEVGGQIGWRSFGGETQIGGECGVRWSQCVVAALVSGLVGGVGGREEVEGGGIDFLQGSENHRMNPSQSRIQWVWGVVTMCV